MIIEFISREFGTIARFYLEQGPGKLLVELDIVPRKFFSHFHSRQLEARSNAMHSLDKFQEFRTLIPDMEIRYNCAANFIPIATLKHRAKDLAAEIKKLDIANITVNTITQ